MKANIPPVPEAPNTLTSSPDNPSATPPLVLAPASAPEPVQEDPPAAKRIRKPSQRIIDLLEGCGRTSNHPSDPVVTPGIQVPTVVEELNCVLEGEGQTDWMMWSDFTTHFLEEHAMAAEIVEAEALEPQSLAEAK